MKKVLVILILFLQFFTGALAKSISDYKDVQYLGTNIDNVVNGSVPCVLVIANPEDKRSIIRYFPIGKMIYTQFKNEYTFCILNVNSPENAEYIEFLNPTELPAVYVINPSEMTFARIGKKYHNSRDMKRILTDMINENKP